MGHMIYGNEVWYCNACGRSMFSPPDNAMGRNFRCCSLECVRTMDQRSARSIMAPPPPPPPKQEERYYSRSAGPCRAGAGYDQFIDCELPDGHSGKHRCGAWEWK